MSGEFEHGNHLGGGFPVGVFEHAETHDARVWWCVIADVWVVNLSGEGYCGWLEGVCRWESEGEIEDSVL